jgi:D-serine deaminase-like pyridoxal phosphate-dependent protein
MRSKEVPTPSLIIDLNVAEANLDRMARYCKSRGVNLRPHTKTHKMPEIAKMQVDRGAIGLTVAKVGEAEVMVAAGLDNILVAFPIWGSDNMRRLAALANGHRILLALDNEDTAQELSRAATSQGSTISVLVEFDTGLHRCGLRPGPDCVKLATRIQGLEGLRLHGLMTYYGNVWGSKENRIAETAIVAERVGTTLDAFAKAGIEVNVVSGGSTPAALLSDRIPGITEIRPGTYVYNDMNTFYQGVCTLEECAVRIVTSVVSVAVPGRAILDAGSKTLSSDLLSSGPKSGYGHIVEVPDAKLFCLSEEHGWLDTTRCDTRICVGDVVSVIPNHVCTCINMHDEAYLVRNGQVVGQSRIAARGKVR